MLAVIAVRTPEWPEQTSRPMGAEFSRMVYRMAA